MQVQKARSCVQAVAADPGEFVQWCAAATLGYENDVCNAGRNVAKPASASWRDEPCVDVVGFTTRTSRSGRWRGSA